MSRLGDGPYIPPHGDRDLGRLDPRGRDGRPPAAPAESVVS